jgi:hypothetical protein
MTAEWQERGEWEAGAIRLIFIGVPYVVRGLRSTNGDQLP